LAKIYSAYYTHDHQDLSRFARLRKKVLLTVCSTFPGWEKLSPSPGWKLAGKIFRSVPTFREMARLMIRGLEGERKGTLLDVGCGNGEFLSLAQRVGWQVLGVEVDPAAAEQARSRYGIPVTVGTLQEAALPANHFDAVNLGHVIEHIYDPVGLLSECRRVLKANGHLFLTTPNVDSLGHQKFRQFWRGLEPPRHFHLFSSNTLRSCVEKSGLRVKAIRTSAQTGAYVWRCSVTRGESTAITWRLRFGGWAFRAREERALKANGGIGEEIVLTAEKAVV
jgi:SAM-dependent methyltransferase